MHKKYYNSNQSIFLFLLLLILIATFRYPGMTPDTISYYEYTNSISVGDLNLIEPFHFAITHFFLRLGLSSVIVTKLVFALYSALSFYFLVKAYHSLPNRQFILIIVVLQTFIYLGLVQMRWGLATAILVYALSNQNFGLTKSALLVSCAGLVHYFAFMFVFISLINRKFVPLKLWLSLPIIFYFLSPGLNPENVNYILQYLQNLSIFDFTLIISKLDFYLSRSSKLDNIYNLFNLFTFLSYAMACWCVVRSIDISTFVKFIPPFCALICMYFIFLPIPIFSRRIMILLLLFSAPIFVCSARYFKPSYFVAFVGLSLSIISFINIGFVKGLVRIF